MPNELRVMTLNAGGARRARRHQIVPDRIAADLYRLLSTIGSADSIGWPTIIAVQESHQVWQGQNTPLETCCVLAQRLGPSYRSYFSPYLDSSSHVHPNKWEQPLFKGFDRVKQGNAVITNMTCGAWPWGLPQKGYPGYKKNAPISTQISSATLYSTGDRNTEPRNLMVMPLTRGQGEETLLYFMATHLTTLRGEVRHANRDVVSKKASNSRLAQIHEILRVTTELREAEHFHNKTQTPIILAGDFNTEPDSPELRALEQTFSRLSPRWYGKSKKVVYTHSDYKILVDHIFYNDPNNLLTPVDCRVLTPEQVDNTTDHLPMIAKFRI
jgi:endonuclease/exonuclease/phosphatase family metal-dependent hydrolase